MDPSNSLNNDELLAELLEQLIEQSKHGRAPQLETVVSQHPELETELRELWATAMIAEDFVSFSGELDELTAASAWLSKPSPTLPKQIGDYTPVAEIGPTLGRSTRTYEPREAAYGPRILRRWLEYITICSASGFVNPFLIRAS